MPHNQLRLQECSAQWPAQRHHSPLTLHPPPTHPPTASLQTLFLPRVLRNGLYRAMFEGVSERRRLASVTSLQRRGVRLGLVGKSSSCLAKLCLQGGGTAGWWGRPMLPCLWRCMGRLHT